jgi:hypothetical protein
MHRNPHELVKVSQGENTYIFKMNNDMVIILPNLKLTMCHLFICDEIQMLTIVTFDIDSSKGDNVKVATAITKLIPNSP